MGILINVDNLGRVVIPQNILSQAKLKPGEKVVVFEEENRIKILKIEPDDKEDTHF